jgi:archaeosine-15-forming tRNA-guanine transglycosylase
MTDRVFEDERSFEVSGRGRSVEVYVDDNVMIEVIENNGWDSQRANFTLTAEEATALKEFLIRKGY